MAFVQENTMPIARYCCCGGDNNLHLYREAISETKIAEYVLS